MVLVIAGERSGVGKTTVTLAMLAYLRHRDLSVQSFKVGPDYIDPMFHQFVTGRPCRNLDMVLTSEAYVRQCVARHTQEVDRVLIEGVMGMFDGAATAIQALKCQRHGWMREAEDVWVREDAGIDHLPVFASTAHVARSLNCPVLLVVDCSRMSFSVAAFVQGYRDFVPGIKLAGVVLNRVGSDRHLELLQTALNAIHVPVLGVVYRGDPPTLPDRHLGLVPAAELANLEELIAQLADRAKDWFNWSTLHPLLKPVRLPKVTTTTTTTDSMLGASEPASDRPIAQLSIEFPPSPVRAPLPRPRIAIAQDSAFSFYYADNLEILQTLGADLVSWSPIADAGLPENIQGLYFGGGFPEVFAARLAANQSARDAVRNAIRAGMPTYAECGGLMYLCQNLVDFAGESFPMVGILPTDAVMGAKLTLGYREAIAQQSTPLLFKGQSVFGHEFHRSQLTAQSESPLFAIASDAENQGQRANSRQKAEGKGRKAEGEENQPFNIQHPTSNLNLEASPGFEGWHLRNLHASYIHLHWGATPELPQRFVDQCHLLIPT
jgi:cobyrinic acid a,c-diamide synthase